MKETNEKGLYLRYSMTDPEECENKTIEELFDVTPERVQELLKIIELVCVKEVPEGVILNSGDGIQWILEEGNLTGNEFLSLFMVCFNFLFRGWIKSKYQKTSTMDFLEIMKEMPGGE